MPLHVVVSFGAMRDAAAARRADATSLRSSSKRAVEATLEKREKRRRRDDDKAQLAEGNATTTARARVNDDAEARRTIPGRSAASIAAQLGVALPFARGDGSTAATDDDVGACGVDAKTNAESSEEEWDDVDDERDYGAYVPDVEPEERVGLEDAPENAGRASGGGDASTTKKKKKSRRLSDDERRNLLETHHTHVLCLVARGRLVRAAASSEILRALVTSCAPRRLVDACTTTTATVEVSALARIVDWFADATAPPIAIDGDDVLGAKKAVKDARWRRLAFRAAMHRASAGATGSACGIAARLASLWALRGRTEISEEECAALFAALCQGLGLMCRVVSSLEPVPVRASAAKLESMGVLHTPKPLPLETVRRREGLVRHWCEVLCARHDAESNDKGNARWVSVVPTTRASVDAPEIIFGNRKRGTTADATSSMPYVVAFYADSGARDVTRKYSAAFSQALHHRTPDWKWWEKITEHVERIHRDAIARDASPELRKVVETADATELFEMDVRSSKERVPGTMTEIKNHPLWVVERFLSRSQCIHPRHPVKGLIAGEPVFPRSCVKELKSAERWKSECRRRVIDTLMNSPVRKIHSRASQARVKALTRAREGWFMTQAEGSKERLDSEEWRVSMSEHDDCPDDPQRIPGDIALYGEWQTEPWTPPAAVGGLVPKNDRGNVDLYGNALPPPGTVHVNLPRIAKTAKSMSIDYAPALVGFEYKAGGKTLPVFNGIVVCEEFKDDLLSKHEEAEETRRLAIEAKVYKEACLHWRLLLGAIWTRAALREEFQDGEVFQDPTARRIAAARAMHESDNHPTAAVAVEPLELGAAAYVEEL